MRSGTRHIVCGTLSGALVLAAGAAWAGKLEFPSQYADLVAKDSPLQMAAQWAAPPEGKHKVRSSVDKTANEYVGFWASAKGDVQVKVTSIRLLTEWYWEKVNVDQFAPEELGRLMGLKTIPGEIKPAKCGPKVCVTFTVANRECSALKYLTGSRGSQTGDTGSDFVNLVACVKDAGVTSEQAAQSAYDALEIRPRN
jgi:hypothetical protein